MGFLIILLLVAGQGRACAASESRGRRNPNPHCSFSWEFDSIRLATGTSSNCMHICFFLSPSLSPPPPNPSQNLSCVLGGVWFDLVALNDVALSVGVQKRWEEKKTFFYFCALLLKRFSWTWTLLDCGWAVTRTAQENRLIFPPTHFKNFPFSLLSPIRVRLSFPSLSYLSG